MKLLITIKIIKLSSEVRIISSVDILPILLAIKIMKLKKTIKAEHIKELKSGEWKVLEKVEPDFIKLP